MKEYTSKFREKVTSLLKEGKTVDEIIKTLGCSITTVYRYKEKHPKYNEQGLRRCGNCQEYKSITEYNKDSYAHDKLQNICKECNKERGKAYRIKQKCCHKENSIIE